MTIFRSNSQAKSAKQSVIIFTVFTFLQPFISFLLLPIYLKYLSIEQYGSYTLLLTISALIGIIGGLNTTSAVVPLYFRNKTTIQSKAIFLNSIFNFNIITNLILAIIFLLIGSWVFRGFISDKNITFFPYGFLAILSGLTSQFLTIFLTFEKNERKVYKYAFVQTVSIILSVGFQILFAIYFSLEGVMWARFLSNILTFAFLLFLMRASYKIQIDKKIIRSSLNYSLALIPFLLVFWVGRYADRFFLEKFVSLSQIAIYGLMMTFASLVTLCSEALANSIQPFLFEYYSDPSKNEKEINRLYVFFLTIFIVFCASLIFFVSNISFILPNDKYLQIVPFFWFAIIPAFLNGFQYLFFNILTYKLKSKLLSAIQILSVGVQMAFVVMLVQNYEVYGLITASIISNIISLCLTSYFGIKNLKIRYDTKKIVIPAVFFIFVIIASIYINDVFKVSFSILGFILVFVVVAFMVIATRDQLVYNLKKLRK